MDVMGPHGCHGTSWTSWTSLTSWSQGLIGTMDPWTSWMSWVQGIIGTMGLMEFVWQYIIFFSVLVSKTKLWIRIHSICHIVKQHKIYLF